MDSTHARRGSNAHDGVLQRPSNDAGDRWPRSGGQRGRARPQRDAPSPACSRRWTARPSGSMGGDRRRRRSTDGPRIRPAWGAQVVEPMPERTGGARNAGIARPRSADRVHRRRLRAAPEWLAQSRPLCGADIATGPVRPIPACPRGPSPGLSMSRARRCSRRRTWRCAGGGGRVGGFEPFSPTANGAPG